MTEAAALDIIAVRAIESADRERAVWSDADRAWASRAAAEVVGEAASTDLFLARRAQLALERLGDRYRILPRVVGSLRWRPWIAYAVVAAAFVVGFAVDRVGASQRINVLAPPVLVLLAWNLAVYAAIAMGYVIRYGDASVAGPLRRAVMRLATRAPTIHARIGEPLSSAIVDPHGRLGTSRGAALQRARRTDPALRRGSVRARCNRRSVCPRHRT